MRLYRAALTKKKYKIKRKTFSEQTRQEMIRDDKAFYDFTEQPIDLRVRNLDFEVSALKAAMDTRMQAMQDALEAVIMRGSR